MDRHGWPAGTAPAANSVLRRAPVAGIKRNELRGVGSVTMVDEDFLVRAEVCIPIGA